MPEGHTIHGLARAMVELVGQDVSASSPQGRFRAAQVDGAEVVGVEAYGKHLLIDTAAATIHVHLGMRGKWLRFAPVTGPGLPQVRLRLATPEVAWDLIAPSACDLFDAQQRSALVGRLGPDPLRPDADVEQARRNIAAFNGPIGAALLDQAVLAGVGNVFRAEVLHACRIAPDRPAGAVSDAEFDRIWSTLISMMSMAVDEGRIITVDAEDRSSVPEDRSRRVYKQQTCYDCGTPVVTSTVGGRTSYACPRCQVR
jgi:formamidopyrimidine-DNA glycosylase